MRIIPMPTTAGAAVDAAATAATTAAAEPAADGMLSRFRFFGPTTSVGPNSFMATGEDGLPECGALCPVRIPVGRLRYAVRTRADFGRPFRPADAAGRGDSGGTGRVSSARSGGGALRFRSERLRYIRYIRGRFALFRPPVGGAPLPRGGESREIDYIYRCFGLRRDVSDGKTI